MSNDESFNQEVVVGRVYSHVKRDKTPFITRCACQEEIGDEIKPKICKHMDVLISIKIV